MCHNVVVAKEAFMTLRLSQELLNRLDEHAESARRTRGDTVRLILELYLDSIDKIKAKRKGGQ
jgi:predicted DNA-binding protein